MVLHILRLQCWRKPPTGFRRLLFPVLLGVRLVIGGGSPYVGMDKSVAPPNLWLIEDLRSLSFAPFEIISSSDQ